MIDYEAAWNELKDKEWDEKNESKYSYLRMCKIENGHTIPPGQPLTPRQAWLAFANGFRMKMPGYSHWFGLQETGPHTWNVKAQILNSGKAVIVSDSVETEAVYSVVPDGCGKPVLKKTGEIPVEEARKMEEEARERTDLLRKQAQEAFEDAETIRKRREVDMDTEAEVIEEMMYPSKPQPLIPRCDACAWGCESDNNHYPVSCQRQSILVHKKKDYWCSRFLPRDLSHVRCGTCRHFSDDSIDGLESVLRCTERLPSEETSVDDYCGHWSVTPPAWRE
jgi:hypothetical protein